ncbi:glycosyltransferase family 39 protein [Flavobacterium urocaniciphilum]|uniref:Dolichyl-phosphate-mannose-protein mannosyltransferase n=1 Tax=Flavobacterium urocaniciphilum TaxID=1299341 RepID=A0A1H8YZZ4_9FLAO|nr:glycosyltransferase family 39 protein [Flavobacterium urocaniciphilum]SEP57683.1 Dolichyl-phosphate-mannose-protein mannosyltransferase [Flavobacterium urocaniciphilum]
MNQHILNNKYIYLLVLILFVAKCIFFAFYGTFSEVPDSFSFNFLTTEMLTNNFDEFLGDRSPGYPFIMYLLNHNKIYLVFVQFLMGIISSVFWYKTLVKLNFKEKFSFYATLFFSFYLQNFFYETFVLIETFALLLNSIILYILINNYFEKKQVLVEIALSVLLAILFLVKPFFMFYPFLIFALYLLKNFSFKKLYSIKLIIFILPAIAYYQWSSFVEEKVGYFKPTIYAGLNLAQTCIYFAEKSPEEFSHISKPYIKYRDEMIRNGEDESTAIWRVWGGQHLAPKYTKFADVTNQFGIYARATIYANFGDYLYYAITKSWFNFWKIFDMKPYMEFKDNAFNSAVSIINSIQKILVLIIKFVFLILSFYYLYDLFKNRKINAVMVLLAFIHASAILQALATYGTNAKYAFPYEFFMFAVVLVFLKEKFNWFSKWQHISQPE